MSSQDPQSQYHDYAAKLDAAKQSVKVDESLRYAVGENDEIFQKLKQMEDGKLYRKLHAGYLLISTAVFILHIIFHGLWVGLLGLILLPAFYFISKITIDREIKISNSKNRDKAVGDLLSIADLNEMISSTSAIIDLKTKRYQILLILTALFTPLIFMAINEMILGELNALNIGLAIVLGSFFWMIYFKKDLDHLQEMKDKLKSVMVQVCSS